MRWLVIASQIKVRIYHQKDRRHLQLIGELSNPLGRVRSRELRHDKPGLNINRGRVRKSIPYSRTGEKDPVEDLKDQFSRELSEFIYKEYQNSKVTEIKFVANPNLIGKTRPHLEKLLKKVQIDWITKDLEKVPQSEWPKLLDFLEHPRRNIYSKKGVRIQDFLH